MRLPAMIVPLLCATAALAPALAAADSRPRTEIAIFRYDGAVSNSDAMQAFEAFNGMIRHKILNIQDHLAETLGAESEPLEGLDYIFDLKVDARSDGSGLSRSEVQDWLGNKDEALQAYLGTIIRAAGGSFELLTRCYLLEAPGQPGLRAFNLQTAISSAEFENIRDGHSLMILYGIALEARRLGVPVHKIAIIVNDAMNLIADIENRQTAPDPDLAKIRDAWIELSRAL